jgi:hypothetical protein
MSAGSYDPVEASVGMSDVFCELSWNLAGRDLRRPLVLARPALADRPAVPRFHAARRVEVSSPQTGALCAFALSIAARSIRDKIRAFASPTSARGPDGQRAGEGSGFAACSRVSFSACTAMTAPRFGRDLSSASDTPPDMVGRRGGLHRWGTVPIRRPRPLPFSISGVVRRQSMAMPGARRLGNRSQDEADRLEEGKRS